MKLKQLWPGLNPFFWLVFAVGLLTVSLPYVGSDFGYLPGDLGDTRLNVFFLENAKQFFSGEVDTFWSAGFMYPEAEVISLSDNFLGTAPVYALFRWLRFDQFTSFQFWMLVMVFLNFWASYKLAEYLLNDKKAAVVAAFVFAFSLSLASQMNHAQTFPRFAIPLSLLFLLSYFKDLKTRDFVFFVTLLVYQFYCGIYLGFMLLLPFAFLFIAGAMEKWPAIREKLRSLPVLLTYLLALAVNALLLLKLFMPYLRRAIHGGLHSYSRVYESIPTPLSYLSANPSSLLYPRLNEISNHYPAFWDHWIFPGWLTLVAFISVSVLIVIRLVRPRTHRSHWFSRPLWLFLTAGLFTFLVFLRIDLYSPYFFIQIIPGFGALRSLTRIINVELLFMGLSLAWIITEIWKWWHVRIWVKHLALVLFFSVLLLENQHRPDKIIRVSKADIMERHEAMIEKMQMLPPGSIISYEPDSVEGPIIFYQLDAMLAAQELHLKSINGYSATSPYMYDPYWRTPNEETRLYWLGRFPEMRDAQVHVIK